MGLYLGLDDESRKSGNAIWLGLIVARIFQSHGSNDKHKVFMVETLQGEYLGQASLDDIDYVSRHAELGIIIGRTDLHGQGYGSDAVQVLLRVAFQVLNMQKVYLRVISGNQTAIRIYQKCGSREAVRPSALFHPWRME